MVRPFHIPQRYRESEAQQEDRKEQWAIVQENKTKKIIQQQEVA